MKQRPRIYYTEADKALMWDRWQAGDSLHAIAQLLIGDTRRFKASLRRQAVFARQRADDRGLRLAWQNEKRFLAV